MFAKICSFEWIHCGNTTFSIDSDVFRLTFPFSFSTKKLQLMVSFWPTLQVASPYPRNEFQFLLQRWHQPGRQNFNLHFPLWRLGGTARGGWRQTSFYLNSPFSSLMVWHWLEDTMLKQPVQNNDFTLKPIDVDVNVEQDLTWHMQTCLLARPGKKSNRTRGTW